MVSFPNSNIEGFLTEVVFSEYDPKIEWHKYDGVLGLKDSTEGSILKEIMTREEIFSFHTSTMTSELALGWLLAIEFLSR